MNDGFGELWRRLMALVRRNQLDADLEEEMRLHIELRTQQQTESGTAPDEARYAAQRRFGNTLLLKEAAARSLGLALARNLVAGSSIRKST